MWCIETFGLSKSYGSFQSLVDCNLRVPRGRVFGLLGPNGAGKTTLIRSLLGFIRPTSGNAKVCGFDVVSDSLRVREQVSYLPGDARLYRSMRGRDVLQLFAGLHRYGNLESSREVAQRLDLDIARRVMFMSTGMRQKLAIAVVLGCDAPLVVLDEPTANLDPNVRQEVLKLVAECRQRGNSVVLSSHIFSDIDEACDRVAILRHGRVVAERDLDTLQQTHLVAVHASSESTLSAARAQEFVDFVEVTPKGGVLHLTGPPQRWLTWLDAQPFEVGNISQAGIQSIYDRYSCDSPQRSAGQPTLTEAEGRSGGHE